MNKQASKPPKKRSNELKDLYNNLFTNEIEKIAYENEYNHGKKLFNEVLVISKNINNEILGSQSSVIKILKRPLLNLNSLDEFSNDEIEHTNDFITNHLKIIENKTFIDALKAFVGKPCEKNLMAFKSAWGDVAINNKLIKEFLSPNRVAAFCTSDVSFLSDCNKTDKFFSWLIDKYNNGIQKKEELLKKYKDNKTWFSKNIFLMRHLKEIFAEELSNGTIDAFSISYGTHILYERWMEEQEIKKKQVQKHSVFIDANILLDFYRYSKVSLEHLEKLAKQLIKDEMGDLAITCYTTKQLKDEFYRNREKVIVEALQKDKNNNPFEGLKNYFKKEEREKWMGSNIFKQAKNYSGFKDKAEQLKKSFVEIEQLVEAFNTKRYKIINNVKEEILEKLPADKLIDKIFNASTCLRTTDKIIKKAKKRVDLGNPPGKKGSLGDAIHWESLLEVNISGKMVIVSRDGDFASPLQQDDKPADSKHSSIHSFLEKECQKKNKNPVDKIEYFSTGAIKEANQPDKTPVGLMNGEQLVTLLMEYNIGVRRMSHDLFELEELPIEKDLKI